MMTSKSSRAVLPSLDDDELERLREWSAENCAASAVFREDDAVIWLASKERTRSREAFLRSARSTLRRLAVDLSQLKGRWLLLTDDSVVRSMAGGDGRERSCLPGCAVTTASPTDAPPPAARAEVPAEPESGDVRVIPLGRSMGQTRPRGQLQVFTE